MRLLGWIIAILITYVPHAAFATEPVGSLTLYVDYESIATLYEKKVSGKEGLYYGISLVPIGLGSKDPVLKVRYRLALPEGIEESSTPAPIQLTDTDILRWEASILEKKLYEDYLSVSKVSYSPFGDTTVLREENADEAKIERGINHDSNSFLAYEALAQIHRLLGLEAMYAIDFDIDDTDISVDRLTVTANSDSLTQKRARKQSLLLEIGTTLGEFRNNKAALNALLQANGVVLHSENVLHEVLEQKPQIFEAAAELMRIMDTQFLAMVNAVTNLRTVSSEIDQQTDIFLRSAERILDAKDVQCRFCTSESIVKRVPAKYQIGSPEVRRFSRNSYISTFENRSTELGSQVVEIVYPIYLREDGGIQESLGLVTPEYPLGVQKPTFQVHGTIARMIASRKVATGDFDAGLESISDGRGGDAR